MLKNLTKESFCYIFKHNLTKGKFMINKVLILGGLSLTLVTPLHATFSDVAGVSSGQEFLNSNTSGSIGISWFDDIDFSEFPQKVTDGGDAPWIDHPDPALPPFNQLDENYRALAFQLSDDFITKLSHADDEAKILEQIQDLQGEDNVTPLSQNLLLDLKKVDCRNPSQVDLILKEYQWQTDISRKRKLIRLINIIAKDEFHPSHQQVCNFMAHHGLEKEIFNLKYYIAKFIHNPNNGLTNFDMGLVIAHIDSVLEQPNISSLRAKSLKKLLVTCQKELNHRMGL